MYLYACMYVFINMYMRICKLRNMHECWDIDIHIYTYIHIYICIYIYMICVHICII